MAKSSIKSYLQGLVQTFANYYAGGSAVDPRQFSRTGETRFTSPSMGGYRLADGTRASLAIRYDDVPYDEYDKARFYPVLSDCIEVVVSAVSRAGCHFVSTNDQAVELANVLVKPHVRHVNENLARGALQFGNQVSEKVEQYVYNVRTSNTQSDAGKPTYTFPIAIGFKKFTFLDPADTILLVDSLTGDFGGIKQYIPTLAGRVDIPASKLLHYVNKREFDSVYGFAQTKSALPFVRLAEGLYDDMKKWADLFGAPYKVGKFRPGFTPTGALDANGAPVRMDNKDVMLGVLSALNAGADVAFASEFDPSTNQPYWGIELLECKADGAENYVEMIKHVNDQIRTAFGIPAYATSESPDRGTYTLGKSMIDLFLRQVNARLDGLKQVWDEQVLEDWNVKNFGFGAPPIVIEFEPPDIDPGLMLMTAIMQGAAAGRPLMDGLGNQISPDWASIMQSLGVAFTVSKAPVGIGPDGKPLPGGAPGEDPTRQQEVSGEDPGGPMGGEGGDATAGGPPGK